MALHQTSDPPRTRRSIRMSDPPQKWSEKASSDRPRALSRTPGRLSPRDKMSPTRQPIKWSSAVPSNIHSFLVSH